MCLFGACVASLKPSSLTKSAYFFVCDVDLILTDKTIRAIKQFKTENRVFFPIFFRKKDQFITFLNNWSTKILSDREKL